MEWLLIGWDRSKRPQTQPITKERVRSKAKANSTLSNELHTSSNWDARPHIRLPANYLLRHYPRRQSKLNKFINRPTLGT